MLVIIHVHNLPAICDSYNDLLCILFSISHSTLVSYVARTGKEVDVRKTGNTLDNDMADLLWVEYELYIFFVLAQRVTPSARQPPNLTEKNPLPRIHR